LLYTQESVALAQSVLERRESNYKLVSVRYQNGRENKGSVLLAEAYREQAQLDLIRARDGVSVAQARLRAVMNKEHLDTVEVTGEVPLSVLDLGGDLEALAQRTPAYNQARAQELISQEDLTISRGAFLPNLDLTAQALRQGPFYFPERERWAVALTLTVPLFDGLKDLSSYRGAVFTRYAAEGRRRNVLLTLVPQLRDAYTQAKQSDLKLSIDAKFRQASGTRAEIAREKYNNGLLTFEDWDIIENELIQRQTNYLQSKRDRALKYATWENVLGKGSIE
jgi:outer membrane protein TolC